MTSFATTALGFVPTPEMPTAEKMERYKLVKGQGMALVKTVEEVLLPRYKHLDTSSTCRAPFSILEKQIRGLANDLAQETDNPSWYTRAFRAGYITWYTERLVQHMQGINRTLLLITTVLDLKKRGANVSCSV